MHIFRTIIDNYDCNDNLYYFITNNAVLKIFQGLNCDLCFSLLTFNSIEKKVSFSIKKEEYFDIYNLVEDMLCQIEGKKYLDFDYGNGKKIYDPDYAELYKNGYFSWQSDAPANEYSHDEFIYNYFNILSYDNEFVFEFVNNIGNKSFTVEVNTDRSRYGMIRFDIFDFFLKLESIYSVSEFETDVRPVVRRLISNNNQKNR